MIKFDSGLEPGIHIETRFGIIEAKMVLEPEEEQNLKKQLKEFNKRLTQSKIFLYIVVIIYVIINVM